MITGPPVEDYTSNDLADWLELEVLCSRQGRAPIKTINTPIEAAENREPQSIDGEDEVKETRLQQLFWAIDERRTVLGMHYPFVLDGSGMNLLFRQPSEITFGGATYLFCLVVSSAIKGGPLSGKGPWSPDLDRARSLFQVCATLAAAGHVNGPAYSTGWPRPDSSSFIEKLKICYAEFGDGTVHDFPPPGSPPQVKDDEIDVIAWQHTGRARPPLGYLLGQAAAGANWNTKSLKAQVEPFHDTWFVKGPASHPRLATIIPFNLPSPADGIPDDHISQAAITTKIRRFVTRHEQILPRQHVVRYVQKAMSMSRRLGTIERRDDFHEVVEFVEFYLGQLQAAVGVA